MALFLGTKDQGREGNGRRVLGAELGGCCTDAVGSGRHRGVWPTCWEDWGGRCVINIRRIC